MTFNRSRVQAAVWCGFMLMALLAAASMLPGGRGAAKPLQPKNTEELFLIYKGTLPIGYSHTRFSRRPGEDGAPDEWLVESEIYTQFSWKGELMDALLKSNEAFSGNLRVKRLYNKMTLGRDTYIVAAESDKDMLYVTARHEGNTLRKAVPYPMGCISPSTAPLLMAASNGTAGAEKRSFKVLSVQLTKISTSEMPVYTLGRSIVSFAGKKVQTRRYRAVLDGIETFYKIDAAGTVYEASQPTLGIIQKKARISDVLAMDSWLPWDLARMPIAASNLQIKAPERLISLGVDMEWKGKPPETLRLQSDRQAVVRVKRNRKTYYAQLYISREPGAGVEPQSFSQKQLMPYLAADATIQTAHPSVITAAIDAAAHAGAPRKTALLVARWIQKNIMPDPTAWGNPPNAAKTLETRTGMNKHVALLFAAMARARNVPVRLCAGKLYTMGFFVPHYWNEIYLNGRWMTMDVLAGEPDAPAPVRIKLAHAATLAQVVSMAGAVEDSLIIRVRDFASEK